MIHTSYNSTSNQLIAGEDEFFIERSKPEVVSFAPSWDYTVGGSTMLIILSEAFIDLDYFESKQKSVNTNLSHKYHRSTHLLTFISNRNKSQ